MEVGPRCGQVSTLQGRNNRGCFHVRGLAGLCGPSFDGMIGVSPTCTSRNETTMSSGLLSSLRMPLSQPTAPWLTKKTSHLDTSTFALASTQDPASPTSWYALPLDMVWPYVVSQHLACHRAPRTHAIACVSTCCPSLLTGRYPLMFGFVTPVGDTVNMASRMESNSEKNRIHMSEASAVLLRKQAPELPTISRGKLAIKGKQACDVDLGPCNL